MAFDSLVICFHRVICIFELSHPSIIDRLDGVRLLWSLLKSNNPKVS